MLLDRRRGESPPDALDVPGDMDGGELFEAKPSLLLGYITGALLMVPLVVLIIVPFAKGDWHSSNMTWTISGQWGGLGEAAFRVVGKSAEG